MTPSEVGEMSPTIKPLLRAAVFDLGGVIVTTMAPAVEELVAAYATKRSLPMEQLHEVWRSLYTAASLGQLASHELWRLFRRVADLAALPVGEEDDALVARIQLREAGISQTVARLKEKYAVGLLSNYVGTWARALLERFDLGRLWDAVVISSDVGVRKPAPGIYEYVCELLRVPPGQAAYVGDEEEDMVGALAVGMLPLFIPGEDAVSSVGLIFNSVSDVATWLLRNATA